MSALKAISGSFEWNEYLSLQNSFTLRFRFSTPNGTVYNGIRIDHLTFSMYYICVDYVEKLVYKATFLDQNARAFKTLSERVVLQEEQSYILQQLTPLSGYIFNAYPIILDTRLPNLYIEGSKYVFDDNYDVGVVINGYENVDDSSVRVTVENATYDFNSTYGTITLSNATNDVIINIKGVLKSQIIDIILYNNISEKNRLNKSSFLTKIDTVSGTFRDDVSLTNLEVDVEYNIVDYANGSLYPINYIYIPTFRRFYFVDDIMFLNNNLITLKCSIDVLYTYRSKILELYGFIDRNEYDYNDKIIDTKRVVEQGVDIISFSATNSDFDTLSGTITDESNNVVINALASTNLPQ